MGQGYWQDFYAASSGDNALQVTTTGAASTAGFFSINPTNNSGERYWTVYVTSNLLSSGNGTYTFQMPVNQDKI